MAAQTASAVFAGSGTLYSIFYPNTVSGQVVGLFDVAIQRFVFDLTKQPVFATELYLGALRSAAPILVTQAVHSIRVRFAGSGSMSARTRFPNPAQASFGGIGDLSLRVNTGQRISARFAGAGSFVSIVAPGTRKFTQTQFAGAGGMSIDTRQTQRIPIQATFSGAGSISPRPRGPTFDQFRPAGAGSFRPWVQFGTFTDSSVDLDFANSRYWNGAPGADITTLLQCARNCTAYAVKLDGSLQSFAANVLRITNQGLLTERQRTNVVLWSRDLTNAAWTKSGVTVALDQTDAEGIANAASSLTATSSNGTVMQAITLASSDRAQSVWVKRLVGSGAIQMTQDNGATWTTIPVTSSWARADLTFQTLANPTVGLRIATAGDSIAVDFMQNEDGRFSTSPIATTTASATRLEDFIVPLSQIDTILDGPSFTLLVERKENNYVQGGIVVGDQFDNSRAYCGTSAVIGKVFTEDFDGFLLRADIGSGLSLFNGDVVKIGTSYGASTRSIVAGGGTVASDSHRLPYTNHRFGGSKSEADGGGGFAVYGYFKRITFWNTQLSDSRLQMLTLP